MQSQGKATPGKGKSKAPRPEPVWGRVPGADRVRCWRRTSRVGSPRSRRGQCWCRTSKEEARERGRGRASERSAAGGVGLLCSAQGEACRHGSIGPAGHHVGARAGRPQQRGLARGHDEPTGTERTEAARARRGGTRDPRGRTRGSRAPRARGSWGGGKQRDRGRRLGGRLVRGPGRDVLPSTSAIGSLAQAAPVTRLRSHRGHPAGLPGATAPAPRRLRRSAMRSAVGSSHAHSRALTGRPKGNAGVGHAQRTRGQTSPDGTVTTGMCCWPGWGPRTPSRGQV